MSYRTSFHHTGRGVVALGGSGARGLLQGLVTNDVDLVSASAAVYAALLTPQGNFLHDFLIAEHDGRLLLDCDGDRVSDLVRLLSMYRLRADVRIEDLSGQWRVLSAWPAAGAPGAARRWGGGVAFTDPRHAGLGDRAMVPARKARPGEGQALAEDYAGLRIGLGIPDGAADLVAGKTRPLEAGLHDLNGVSFDKGCFVGQEVVARMKHRRLVRRRLVPVTLDGAPPAPGTAIAGAGTAVGEIRSGTHGRAIAMLRLDRIDDTGLAADGRPVRARRPDWMTDSAHDLSPRRATDRRSR